MASVKINEQISFLLKCMDMTRGELAKALGVTEQTVSMWESAQSYPDIRLLPDIADLFGVSVDELLGHMIEKPSSDEQLETLDDTMVINARIVARTSGRINTSTLQRKLAIGYLKSSRLMKRLEELGCVVCVIGDEPSDVYYEYRG